jgi:hypothetical protein
MSVGLSSTKRWLFVPLSRIFALDMDNCDHCGSGEMKVVSAVIKQENCG